MSTEPKIVELDVRPYLRKKIEPFSIIMEEVNKLNEEDTFILHATFNPKPLLGVMERKGFTGSAEKVDKKHWVVTFVHSNRTDAPEESMTFPRLNLESGNENNEPQVYKLDNRGLEPPQPMVRTLTKLESCSPGDKVIIHNDRVPVFLIEELNELGYPFSVENQSDGSARVTITKK